MKKRHIAFLISDMAAGGAQRVASILCSYWASQGHKVTLITFEPETTASFYDLHPDIILERLNLLGGSGHILKAIPANMKRIRALRSLYRWRKPDVLITFMPESNVLGVLSAIGLGIPVLVSERSDPRYIPAQKVWKLLRRITYPLAKAITCQTPKVADFFDYHKNCVVLPNPLPPPPTSYDREPDFKPPNPFIAGLGRLGHEKGFDILIDAFSKIKDRFPEHHLVILGEGQERASLEKQIKGFELEDRVHLPGQKKRPFSILKNSSIFVVPSRFEGFPNGLCEAMAHGLPVISSSSITAPLSVIRNDFNALVIEDNNSDMLAEALITLLNNPQKAKELGHNAQHIMDEISAEKVCAQWESLIDSVCI